MTGVTRVLVTGGASGLGQELARQYLARGAQVLVGDLAETRPDSVPEGAAYLTLDVRSDLDWEAARDWVTREWGSLDVLVNNAGIATGGRIDIEAMAEWDRVLAINVLGVARGCRTFTPMLKAQRAGRIVNVASLAGLVHGAGMASYNASKAAVVALSETLRYELAPFGITTCVVCPSFFRTNLHLSYHGADPQMARTGQKLIQEAPYSAEEIAAAVLAGVDAGEAVILPDAMAREVASMKIADRSTYDHWAMDGAQRLARRELDG